VSSLVVVTWYINGGPWRVPQFCDRVNSTQGQNVSRIGPHRGCWLVKSIVEFVPDRTRSGESTRLT
jgi:hypothetical protein